MNLSLTEPCVRYRRRLGRTVYSPDRTVKLSQDVIELSSSRPELSFALTDIHQSVLKLKQALNQYIAHGLTALLAACALDERQEVRVRTFLQRPLKQLQHSRVVLCHGGHHVTKQYANIRISGLTL